MVALSWAKMYGVFVNTELHARYVIYEFELKGIIIIDKQDMIKEFGYIELANGLLKASLNGLFGYD